MQPGGTWSGDYLVVDFEHLQKDPDAKPADCRIHRIAEVFVVDTTGYKFPLADYRNKAERTIPTSDEAPAEKPSSASGGHVSKPIALGSCACGPSLTSCRSCRSGGVTKLGERLGAVLGATRRPHLRRRRTRNPRGD